MSRKKILLFLFLLLVVVIAGTVYYNSRPVKILQSALVNLADSQSQAFTADISVSNPQASLDILGEQASVELKIVGQYERQDKNRSNVEALARLTTKTATTTWLLEANTKFIDDQAYFQITQAPPTLPALAGLKGQWITLPRGSSGAPEELPDQQRTFLAADFINSQNFDGDKVKIYQASATSIAVIRILDGIAAVLGTHLTAEQINQIQEGIAQQANLPVEIAITPWSREVRYIKSTTTVPPNNNTISIAFTFSNRNQPVAIIAPPDAKTLGEIAGLSSGISQ